MVQSLAPAAAISTTLALTQAAMLATPSPPMALSHAHAMQVESIPAFQPCALVSQEEWARETEQEEGTEERCERDRETINPLSFSRLLSHSKLL